MEDPTGKSAGNHDVFRLLVESVRDHGVVMLGTEGRVRTWNAGASALFGYAPEDITWQSFRVFYPEEDRRQGKPELLLGRALHESLVQDECWWVRQDGSRFWARVKPHGYPRPYRRTDWPGHGYQRSQ